MMNICDMRDYKKKCYKCSKFGQIANCRPSAVQDDTHETREHEKRETKIHTKLKSGEVQRVPIGT